MTSDTRLEVEQAQHIAQLQREIAALRTLIGQIVEAWYDPNTGRMTQLIKLAQSVAPLERATGAAVEPQAGDPQR